MTDPRLIECAKAIKARPWCADMSDRDAVVLARTVILKWLEQEPSDAMAAAARTLGNEYNEYNAGEDVAYTAMCAQAAKELAE